MVSEAEASSDAKEAMTAAYYVYEDVDQTFKKAIERGATMILEATDMPYLDRQAGVRDMPGNVWWISKRLVDEPYDS